MERNNNSQDSQIRRAVMGRVRAMHMIRPLLSGAAAAIVLFLVSLYAIGREVWVARVLENMPHESMAAVLRFSEAAFLNTSFLVQALLVVAIIAFGWALRDIARSLTMMTPPMARMA